MLVTDCSVFSRASIQSHSVMKETENLLIVADSEHDANMLYAVGMFVPDPFIYLRLRGRPCVVMSDLEIDRARREASHCRLLRLSDYQRKLRAAGKVAGFSAVIHAILSEQRIRSVAVPGNFPLALAVELDRLGIKLKPKPGMFFDERETKTSAEVKKISAALTMAEVGMAEGIQALRMSKVGKNRQLIYRGAPLTSEKLRSIIDTAILQTAGLANRTIVAGGKQGCDPHEGGHGPLRADEPIILDIFPRSQKTGYFGDITRTVVKGRASEAVRQLYNAVLTAQTLAFKKVRTNTPTAEIHRAVQDFFTSVGYKTSKRNGRMEGFFHGTGHGLGLEIHEAPRLGTNATETLRAGHVITIEPGLYYPEIGGVRIEDVALVTDRGARNLTRFEKVLEI
jgi:Xaa-Pro aminopeptidase